MRNKIQFLKQAISNYKQVWAILPSSRFLTKYMVREDDIKKSKVIVEIWAWTWSFTSKIFENIDKMYENKNVFIIEKDDTFYKTLNKKLIYI